MGDRWRRSLGEAGFLSSTSVDAPAGDTNVQVSRDPTPIMLLELCTVLRPDA